MVLGTQYLIRPASESSDPLVLHPQPSGQPSAHRTHELSAPFWKFGEVSYEQTLESLQRFFVEDNVIYLIDRQPTIIEAPSYGLHRKSGVVFDSREAFFLSGSHNLAVHHQGGGRVMKISADADNLH